MEKQFKNYLSKMNQNKIAVLIVLIAVILLGGIFYVFIGNMYSSRMYTYKYDYAPLAGAGLETPFERQIDKQTSEILSEPTEYQIKKGTVIIKSSDVISDYEKLSKKTESLNGWIEAISKSEDYAIITITTNLKVPSENFDPFADWLMENFDVKYANLELYKISVERQQDEIQILLTALDVYDRLMERAEKMNVSESSIEVIMEITQRKLDIMRLLRQYGYDIEQIEKEANYSTVILTLTQEKKIKIMPENLGQELRDKMRNSVRDIANALMDILTIPIVLFIKVVVWIVYALIVIIPVFIVYKILMKVLKFISKKI